MDLNEVRNNYSELGKQLFDRLQAICDDYDFLICSIGFLKTDDNFQKMLDFLDKTKTTDTDDIIPYIYKLNKEITHVEVNNNNRRSIACNSTNPNI